MIPVLFTLNDWALLLLRIVLGIILLVHGLPKLKNLSKTAQDFSAMGFKLSRFWGTIVALLEVGGGLALMAGLLTQLVALFVVIQFLVITLTVKRKTQFVGGVEFDFLILVTAAILATAGGGIYSLDAAARLFLY